MACAIRHAGKPGHFCCESNVVNVATLALKKALIERALGGEMNHRLGYPTGPVSYLNRPGTRGGCQTRLISGHSISSRFARAQRFDGSRSCAA